MHCSRCRLFRSNRRDLLILLHVFNSNLSRSLPCRRTESNALCSWNLQQSHATVCLYELSKGTLNLQLPCSFLFLIQSCCFFFVQGYSSTDPGTVQCTIWSESNSTTSLTPFHHFRVLFAFSSRFAARTAVSLSAEHLNGQKTRGFPASLTNIAHFGQHSLLAWHNRTRRWSNWMQQLSQRILLNTSALLSFALCSQLRSLAVQFTRPRSACRALKV